MDGLREGSSSPEEYSIDRRYDRDLRSVEDIIASGGYDEEQLAQLRLIHPIYVVMADYNSDNRDLQKAIFQLGELSKASEDGTRRGSSMKSAEVLRNIARSSNASDALQKEAQRALSKMGLTAEVVSIEESEESDIDWRRVAEATAGIVGLILAAPLNEPPVVPETRRADTVTRNHDPHSKPTR